MKRVLKWAGVCVLGIAGVGFAIPLGVWHFTAGQYDGYNYYTYGQMEVSPTFLHAGDLFPPDSTAYTTDGREIELRSMWRQQPLVLETGIRSCPIYWKSETSMSALAETYRDDVTFAVLYTREAHPGLLARPHVTRAEKLVQAQALDKVKVLGRPVLVDALDGSLHRRLGGGPNSVFVIGTDGVVAHYAYWNAPDRKAQVVADLMEAGGRGNAIAPSMYPCPDLRQSVNQASMRGMTLGIASVGGPDALADFLIHLPGLSSQQHPGCARNN